MFSENIHADNAESNFSITIYFLCLLCETCLHRGMEY